MNRRTYLKGVLAIAGGQAAKAQAPKGKRPIQLRLDLMVDPRREQEMLTNFEKIDLY